MTYKADHEAFVSGGRGSTQYLIAVTVIATILPVHICDMMRIFIKQWPEKTISGFILDFLIIVFPLQCIMSVVNQYSVAMLMIQVLAITILFGISPQQPEDSNKSTEPILMGNRRPFITYFRAYVNLITAFSILAVDFKIFPRYFAKAETYGTGLMDVGVGCFMISNAIVSPEARGKSSNENVLRTILNSIKSSIPLVLLGCLRVVLVKSTDYQEHVTEYGVHWNFFFTLAAVKILVTLMLCTVPNRFWNMAGVGIVAVYQHSLTFDGLKTYIVKGEDGRGGRHGFIDANREGLYSCCGYLSLYIMGVQLGKLLMKKREKVSDWVKLCIHLTMVTAGTWILLYFCEKHVEPVSRRFANLSYVLWMIAFNGLILLVLLIMDILVTCMKHDYRISKNTDAGSSSTHQQQNKPEYSTSHLMFAINFNGLVFFLLANLFTGLVNKLIKTIYQPASVSMAILTTYMFVLCSIMSFLYHKKISLKFW